MQLSMLFVPHESDILSPHIAAIFGFFPRIAFASVVAYLLSQNYDVWIYALLKKRHKEKLLWLRNNISTITSQFIDNVAFTLIAFVGVFSWGVMLEIFVTSMILKIIISLLDTPVVYWVRSWRQ